MNLYEATIDFHDDQSGTVHLGDQDLAIGPEVLEHRPALRDHGKVIIGIRPEDFEDVALVDRDTTGRELTSNVRLIEALGSELMVHFDLNARTVDSGDPDAVEESESGTNAVARFNPRSRVKMREDVRIAVATDNMHFFDPETHLSIWK